MGSDNSNPIFAYSALMALAEKLSETADEVLARRDVADALRQAARAIHAFASFKFTVVHIAVRVDSAIATATARAANWDALIAALNETGRELRDAVAKAERENGTND